MTRVLHLTSPLTTGRDVRTLQHAINAQAYRDASTKIHEDGTYGLATRAAEAHAAFLLGVDDPNHHRARAQRIVLHPRLRTPAELVRCGRLKREIARREGSGPQGAVNLALKMARQIPHITEHPPTSNRGPLIDDMQREVGILGAPWCGAGVHWWLKHGGGLDVTQEVRYCPYTVAHAKAGTGGFREWIPVSRARDAPVGSLVLYEEGGVAAHVEILCFRVTGPTIRTVGCNTSAQGSASSQSNGGGIFERERPLHGSFPVLGFAVPRWPRI